LIITKAGCSARSAGRLFKKPLAVLPAVENGLNKGIQGGEGDMNIGFMGVLQSDLKLGDGDI
jgi:hypothetical protein